MGILQARILEWAAMPSSRGSSQPKDQTQVSCIAGRFFTDWATTKPQEYWSGLPCPSPGDLPDPGIEPGASALQVDTLPAVLQGSPIQDHTAASLTYLLSEPGQGASNLQDPVSSFRKARLITADILKVLDFFCKVFPSYLSQYVPFQDRDFC